MQESNSCTAVGSEFENVRREFPNGYRKLVNVLRELRNAPGLLGNGAGEKGNVPRDVGNGQRKLGNVRGKLGNTNMKPKKAFFLRTIVLGRFWGLSGQQEKCFVVMRRLNCRNEALFKFFKMDFLRKPWYESEEVQSEICVFIRSD